MVNLYDSPAQAQFINTYVPIQFEGLYKIAEKAQKDLDEAEALQDEVVSKYSTINTPSKIDKANYEAKYAQINDWVNKNISSSESLKDPVIRSGYKSMVRRFIGDSQIRNIMDNAAYLKDYVRNSDPRWGNYERDIAANFDSSTGMFDKKNLAYRDWTTIQEEEATKYIKPTMKKEGNWLVQSISDKDIQASISRAIPAMKETEEVKAHFKNAIENGEANAYAYTDKNGNLNYDYDRFVYDNAYAAARNKVGVYGMQLDPLYEMQRKYAYEVALRNMDNKSPGTADPIAYEIEQGRINIAKKKADYLKTFFEEALSKSKVYRDKNGKLQVYMRYGKDLIAAGVSQNDVYSILTAKDKSSDSYINMFNSAIDKMYNYMQKVEDGNKGTNSTKGIFGLTSRGINSFNQFDVQAPAAQAMLRSVFPQEKPNQYTDNNGATVDLYTISNNKDYEIIDPSSGSTVSNKITNRLSNIIKSGSISGLVQFGGSVRNVMDDMYNPKMSGNVYVPLDYIVNNSKASGLNVMEDKETSIVKITDISGPKSSAGTSFKVVTLNSGDASKKINQHKFVAIPAKTKLIDAYSPLIGTVSQAAVEGGSAIKVSR